jgi:hypothetical protein
MVFMQVCHIKGAKLILLLDEAKTFRLPLPMIWLLKCLDVCQMAFKVPKNDRY